MFRSRYPRGLTVMLKDSLGRVSQFQHRFQGFFGILHAGPVCLIHNQNICDLKDTSFNGLNIISKAGGFNNESGVRQTRHIHFALTCANGFDDDDVKSGRIKYLRHVGCGLCQPAQGTTRRHRTDEYAAVTGKIAHTDAVTEHRPACEWAGWINGDNCHSLILCFSKM